MMTSERVHLTAAWFALLAPALSGCSSAEDPDRAGGGGASSWVEPENIGGSTPGPNDFYLVHAHEFTQQAGAEGALDLEAASFLNPSAPSNWLSPIDYVNGDIGMYVEVVSRFGLDSDLEYSVSFRSGANPDATDRVVVTLPVPSEYGTVERSWPVQSLARVTADGATPVPVGGNWDWEQAFSDVRGAIEAPASADGSAFAATLRLKVLVYAPH